MRRVTTAALAAAAIFAALSLPGRPALAGAARVAVTGCDDRTIGSAESQLRDWQKYPPRGTEKAVGRLNDLRDLVNSLTEERSVLDAVCPTNMDRSKFYDRISADTAWALSLQSDIILAIGPPCPSAGNIVAIQLLADAWLALAAPINAVHLGEGDPNAPVPPAIAAMQPKIQQRAQALGMTLPAVADTSVYWRDQIRDKAKAAVAACNLPTPTPTATPTMVPSLPPK